MLKLGRSCPPTVADYQFEFGTNLSDVVKTPVKASHPVSSLARLVGALTGLVRPTGDCRDALLAHITRYQAPRPPSWQATTTTKPPGMQTPDRLASQIHSQKSYTGLRWRVVGSGLISRQNQRPTAWQLGDLGDPTNAKNAGRGDRQKVVCQVKAAGRPSHDLLVASGSPPKRRAFAPTARMVTGVALRLSVLTLYNQQDIFKRGEPAKRAKRKGHTGTIERLAFSSREAESRQKLWRRQLMTLKQQHCPYPYAFGQAIRHPGRYRALVPRRPLLPDYEGQKIPDPVTNSENYSHRASPVFPGTECSGEAYSS
ncbi:uncharacterized protein BBA_07789 [Beauveria bassiana ARSEF 2860]|uniref:Uncharacterized protein n=1 Tax=Beauveria bassiana (strain ARSEF 2860) TaxID=655819 RepID=J4KM20_BEAB2|nr:uncharacterized protein BBA_07789 [Beauveria bassiana ARSEF 2860]EJP63189.1 hypothetical protein BBA_07789 [Beauveria bassiana ARSEF 2860]